MSIYLPWVDGATPFPDPAIALQDPNGLLCAGGDLSPGRLLDAYSQGIFPWFSDDEPILWWSPDPRCILEFSDLHISRSMRRFLRQQRFTYQFDRHFVDVMRACAAPRDGQAGTWISEDIVEAYTLMHHLGYGHCIEVWEDSQLVGGLYGLAIGRCFFGESMFSRRTNASKAAFIMLARHLNAWGYQVLDAQVTNSHLLTLGCREIPRRDFMAKLAQNTAKNVTHEWKVETDLLAV